MTLNWKRSSKVVITFDSGALASELIISGYKNGISGEGSKIIGINNNLLV